MTHPPAPTQPRRRAALGVGMTALACAVFGLWWTARSREAADSATPVASEAPANVPPSPPMVPDGTVLDTTELDRQLAIAEAALRDADESTPLGAWSRLRAFGPGAGRPSATLLTQRIAAGDLAWLSEAEGTNEPRVAAAVALVEAGELTAGAAAALVNDGVVDSLGALAWRIDAWGLSLVASEGAAPANRRDLALGLEKAIGQLLRPHAFSDVSAARLAQSVYRAAPLVTDERTELLVRRTLGQLLQTPANTTPEAPSHASARLEAVSVFSDNHPENTSAKGAVRRLLADALRPLPADAPLHTVARRYRALRLARRVLLPADARERPAPPRYSPQRSRTDLGAPSPPR